MKSALIFLTLVAIALSAKVPVSKPAKQEELHGRPLMHPEQKSNQGQQSLQCYESPNQQGSSVRYSFHLSVNFATFKHDSTNNIWIF
jgi:hypothetical protein